MKTKLQILVSLLLLFSLSVAPTALLKAVDDSDTPIITIDRDLPSTAFLKREKRSIANTTESSSFISPVMGMMSAGSWEDPFLAGQDGESSWPGNVGDKGPIGDVSLPIVISILLIYLIYRGVTTSRRRNNL